MCKSLFFIVFLLNCLFLKAQNSNYLVEKDSISSLLNNYKKTSDLDFINKALTIANTINNDSIVRELHIAYGIKSYFKKDKKTLEKSTNSLKKLFDQKNDSLSLAKYYHYKALLFAIDDKTDSSYFYYDKSRDISDLLNDSLSVGRRLLSVARLQTGIRDYLGSEISTIAALRYLEPLNTGVIYVSRCYNNLGTIYLSQNRNEEAREYLKKAFEIGYLNNKKRKLATYTHFYINTALTLLNESRHNEAIELLNNVVKDSIKEKEPTMYYAAIEGVAFNQFKLGKNTEALSGFLKVLEYKKKLNNLRRITITYSILAEFYLAQKKIQEAKKYALKALATAEETNFNDRKLENYKYLAEIEKGAKGKKYLKKYIRLNDSINNAERKLKNQFAKIRYETEKKDIENNKLKVRNEKQQLELEREEQQKIIGWLFASASLFFIAFGIVFVNNRRKKIAFEAKLKQVEAREKERQQIAKSLHDEVAGDIRILHKKLLTNNLIDESSALDKVKDNVRNLSHQLSSVSFDEVSFKNQIINLVSDFFDSGFNIKTTGINDVNWKTIDKSIKRTLFLLIRESIQNTEKYANAKTILLDFEENKKEIHLKIIDDGKGFDTKMRKSGIGLKNMKERVEEINGIFTLESAENKGTQINIIIPKNGK